MDTSSFTLSSSITSTPRFLWDAYVEYLWNYQPHSWVGRAASFFRVLAIVLVLPVVILTLLDVTSYVIARTLGVVDDVKASTSDTTDHGHLGSMNVPGPSPSANVLQKNQPQIRVDVNRDDQDREIRSAWGESEERMTEEERSVYGGLSDSGCQTPSQSQTPSHSHSHSQLRSRFQIQTQEQTEIHPATDPDSPSKSSGSKLRPPEMYYFAGEEGLRLSGVGEFSPAASMPPSPLIPRMTLRTLDSDRDNTEGAGVVLTGEVNEDEGIMLRRRVNVQGVKH